MRDRLIELFYDNNVHCDQKIEELADDVIDTVRAEAIKEFAERLKEKSTYAEDWSCWVSVVALVDVDDIVKEMVGEDK